MSRTDLSQAQWNQLQPLLPLEHSGKKGRPYVSHRSVINGILWRLRTGAPWRDLPTRYGPYQTCAERLARWSKRGLWQTLLQKLQGQADTKGQLDWQTNCADGSVIRAHQHAAGARHGAEAPPAKTKTPTEYAAEQALQQNAKLLNQRRITIVPKITESVFGYNQCHTLPNRTF
jgi:transposase